MGIEGDQLKNLSDYGAVKFGLDKAKEYGLEVEIIVHALYNMRGDPTASIRECIEDALYDWDI